jgi:hypothetical protein
MPLMPWSFAILMSLGSATVVAAEVVYDSNEEQQGSPSIVAVTDRTESAGFNPFGGAMHRQPNVHIKPDDEEPGLMQTSVCAVLGLLSVGALLRAIWMA